ncbi:Neutral and basic amino acid transport protein rBAT [Bagarius yarrelli]|uniref:Neutral and basic amino acid transport protein rBAT n=1 Tax=Bagarius yarrelli TaxID=175774 RepID=A0A556TR98_BAGYA|nr:Neutral and basic amino acid transport protein rBAT [Bagarius yarrelli]
MILLTRLEPNHIDGEEIGMESQVSVIQDPLEVSTHAGAIPHSDSAQRKGSSTDSRLDLYVWADENVFAFLRELDGLNQAFLVLLNFGNDTETDMSAVSELPDQLIVDFSTQPATASSFSKSKIRTSKGQGLLLRYSSSKRFHLNHQSECYISEKACFLSVLNILYQC